MYFNTNDELVDETFALKEMKDKKNKGKYHTVTVDYDGNEGKEKITQDIFWGNKRQENAEIFIDNYYKTKAAQKKKKRF